MDFSFLEIIFNFGNKAKSSIANNSPFWSANNFTVFDGEKTPNELGTPSAFELDYYSLHLRAWESYIKSEIIQNAIKKYVLWIIGAGLKVQSTPAELVIDNTSFKKDIFTKKTESLFRLYAKSKFSSYNQMQNLHRLGNEALKNAMLSGDVLIILRYDGRNVTTQLIDGYYVQQPFEDKYIKNAEKKGNKIENGVEIDVKGKHIAYYVIDNDIKSTRIPAYSTKNKRAMAWLMKGMQGKLDEVRGMSLLTAVLESTFKIDRYKEATIGTAEENSKLVYTIEHNQFSDGENPMINQLRQSIGKGNGTATETDAYTDGNSIATKIAQTTEKQAYNMPIGSKLVQNGGKSDIHFKDFYSINADIIYATLGIPPEVAADKFGGAYSGSRAALKSWEYKMMVDRLIILHDQFYKPIYDFWLDIQILEGNIKADGYLIALLNNDEMKLEAFHSCRFIGAGVPHIDPVKEVKAEREKLGESYNTVPLTTGELSSETLNTGDFDTILEQSAKEIELFDELNKNKIIDNKI